MVVLVGVSGSGKSTFALKHFLPSEILSSDAFRALVSDDENDQGATRDAFDALHYVGAIRLRRRKLIVIDATNVQPEARKPLLELAAAHDCLCVALVMDVPERVCQERNRDRADRQFGPHVIVNQSRQLRQSLRSLKREGFRYIHILSPAQIENVTIKRIPLWTDRRSETGPFDMIGDVHGCYDELIELLSRLGYAPQQAEAGSLPLIGSGANLTEQSAANSDIAGENAAQGSSATETNAEEDSVNANNAESVCAWTHPEGRRVIFLGDLVDRGPGVVQVVELAQAMMRAGAAFCVPGNHDNKLMRALKGNRVQATHGLAESLAQIESLPDMRREGFKADYVKWMDSLVSHLWLDGGALCVAHAGMTEAYIGRASGRVREFALYGDTTGETDEFGLPIRYAWAQEYRGRTTVVYGHTPVPDAEWLNNTINLDTGCVFGGKLSTLRWPERELVQIPAHAVYAQSVRAAGIAASLPLSDVSAPAVERGGTGEAEGAGGTENADPAKGAEGAASSAPTSDLATPGGAQIQKENAPSLSLQWQHDELLRAEDVLGKRVIETRLLLHITIPAANAAAALEVMSRFAVEPRWLIYLPPTMSPCETAPDMETRKAPDGEQSESLSVGYLERPQEAFAYYRSQGMAEVICQRKHMGSRAVVVICRDETAAQKRFGAMDGTIGVCYTRTGRQFFENADWNARLLSDIGEGLTAAGFWEEFATDWVCLDCELMPWNAKAQGLLREQYAPVGAAAKLSLQHALEAVSQGAARGLPLEELAVTLEQRQEDVGRYVEAYGHYCWNVESVEDVRLAPFHLLATEGRTYFDQPHAWHIATLARLAEHSRLFTPDGNANR